MSKSAITARRDYWQSSLCEAGHGRESPARGRATATAATGGAAVMPGGARLGVRGGGGEVYSIVGVGESIECTGRCRRRPRTESEEGSPRKEAAARRSTHRPRRSGRRAAGTTGRRRLLQPPPPSRRQPSTARPCMPRTAASAASSFSAARPSPAQADQGALGPRWNGGAGVAMCTRSAFLQQLLHALQELPILLLKGERLSRELRPLPRRRRGRRQRRQVVLIAGLGRDRGRAIVCRWVRRRASLARRVSARDRASTTARLAR